MRYAHKEKAYSEPIASLLETSPAFLLWILRQTRFASDAPGARLLFEEMAATRSKASRTWWGSHFTMSCKCDGCRGGRETDVLAIVELSSGDRIALHFEVKHPTDRLSQGQAARYKLRANCWAANAPPTMIAHTEATTILLWTEPTTKHATSEVSDFDHVITWDTLSAEFPDAGIPDCSQPG